jgi:MoaA/NifB/PqqE/SkfB family radical SAM enzyme
VAGVARNLEISVSIDGLQPEHDVRRAPATYDRIQKHVTRQQVRRPGYLAEFVDLWSRNEAVDRILVSLYTPQVGEVSDERLEPEDRETVVVELRRLRTRYPKLYMPAALIEVFLDRPASPADCLFAKTTTCVSADFSARITPCQFGGEPDCANCGCVASAGMGAIARHRLPGGLSVGALFEASRRVGSLVGGSTAVGAAVPHLMPDAE